MRDELRMVLYTSHNACKNDGERYELRTFWAEEVNISIQKGKKLITLDDKIRNKRLVKKCQEILHQLRNHPFGPISL